MNASVSSAGAPARGLIVVGVDGSESSRTALRWAVQEALLRRADVRVVHCYWAAPLLVGGPGLPDADPEQVVRDFVLDTVGDQAAVEITPVAIQARQASAALVDEANGADLLVVGSRGVGGFSGLLLGSVSQQCSHHAPCPIVIV